MDIGLSGKRALITGGSEGLGRAVAADLIKEGCDVVIASRTRSKLEAAAADMKDGPGRIFITELDVLDPQSIIDCVNDAAKQLGGLDILVNCAARTGGHGEEADVYETASEKGIMADFEEKVVGSLRLVRAAEQYLRAAGGGRVILFSGGAGRIRGGLVGAGSRNRAINNLALTLANSLGKYGIGVVSVAPGTAVTERHMDAHRRAAERSNVPIDEYIAGRAHKTTMLKRLVMSGDLSKVVAFLCSPLSWPINATNIELAGGSSPDVHYELEPHPPWEKGTAV